MAEKGEEICGTELWRNDTDWRGITPICAGNSRHEACIRIRVLAKSVVCLALLSAAAGVAQTSAFLLGVDYSEWADPNTFPITMATDATGALYVLSDDTASTPQFYVTKLSPDAQTIVWRYTLGFTAYWMAVDPNGGVYVVEQDATSAESPINVVKLKSDGSGIAWTASSGFSAPTPYGTFSGLSAGGLAVDSAGRAYVIGAVGNQGYVVRLKADGTGIDYSVSPAPPEVPVQLAVDGSGSAFFIAESLTDPNSQASLIRLSSDGLSVLYSTPVSFVPVSLVPLNSTPRLVVDPKGDATVLDEAPGSSSNSIVYQAQVQSFNPAGELVFTTEMTVNQEETAPPQLLGRDAAGTTYIGGVQRRVRAWSEKHAFHVRIQLAARDRAGRVHPPGHLYSRRGEFAVGRIFENDGPASGWGTLPAGPGRSRNHPASKGSLSGKSGKPAEFPAAPISESRSADVPSGMPG